MYIYEYTLYTQCLSIRDWLLKFSDCSCDWQMGKKRSELKVLTMMMVTHKKRPARIVAQALRSGVSIALGKRFGRLAKKPCVWLRAGSGRSSVIWTMATTWPKSRSYRNS